MVHLVIDNLLSTSANRPLMEALWFLAVSKSIKSDKSSVIFDNASIVAICQELRAQINNEVHDARDFFFTTQLVFGTLQLYKIQIDKLYDQSKLIVQTWNSSQFNQNWLAEMSQPRQSQVDDADPGKVVKKSKTMKKKPGAAKKSMKKSPKKGVEKKNALPQNLMEDLELMEDIFKVPAMYNADDEETLDYLTSTSKKVKKGKKEHTVVDQTMAVHSKNITLIEASHVAATSGYQTFLHLDDEEDDFGEISGCAFQNLLKGGAPTEVFACRPMNCDGEATSTPNNNRSVDSAFDESQVLTIFHRSQANHGDRTKPPHRLTYSTIEPDAPRNCNNNDRHEMIVENLPDLYQLPIHKELPTFDENANAMEVTDGGVLENKRHTIHNEIPLHVTQNQTLPEISHSDLPLPEIESEMVLEQLDEPGARNRRSKRASKLIVDKQKIIADSTIIKNFEVYQNKSTEHSPFQSFEADMFYRKNCAEVLFSSVSARMSNSSAALTCIYTRNQTMIPEKLLKRRNKEPVVEDVDQENRPSPPKKAKTLRSRKNALKEANQQQQQLLEQLDELLQPEIMDVSPPQAADMQATFEMAAVDLPPIISVNCSLNETDYSPPEKRRRTNSAKQQLNKSSPEETEGSEQDKQVILSKLKELWTKPSQPITMNKLCTGQNRFEAAKTFFELLLLSKAGVVELAQEGDSLEISNICCKISKKQLSKLLR